MNRSAMLSEEDYERLEARFAEERQFFESRAEQHPFLKEVMAGRTSFGDIELALFGQYLRNGAPELDDFANMLTDLTGITLTGWGERLLDLAMIGIPFDRQMGEAVELLFIDLALISKAIDARVCWCYAPEFLHSAPAAFGKAYAEMAETEKEYINLKVLEHLDREYTAFSTALGSLCEQHPFVQKIKIMDGKATFASMARSLNDRFGEMRPTFREQWGQRYLGEVPERSKPYLEELVSFTGAVDSLSGEEVEYEVLDFRNTVEFLLGGLIIKKKNWDMHAFINKEFERYTALAGKLDNRLCLYLAPRSVTETPEAFREAYAAAHPLEKEYVRNRLLKAVGAGAVRGMGEDELLRFLDSLDK